MQDDYIRRHQRSHDVKNCLWSMTGEREGYFPKKDNSMTVRDSANGWGTWVVSDQW